MRETYSLELHKYDNNMYQNRSQYTKTDFRFSLTRKDFFSQIKVNGLVRFCKLLTSPFTNKNSPVQNSGLKLISTESKRILSPLQFSPGNYTHFI